MIPHKQLFRHDPGAGVHGDCFRTVIASLLDMRPEDVPHFYDYGRTQHEALSDGHYLARKWLRVRGLQALELPMTGSLIEVLNLSKNYAPNVFHYLLGESRNETGHVVICRNGKIIHDPSLDDSGIAGPINGYYWLGFLVKYDNNS